MRRTSPAYAKIEMRLVALLILVFFIVIIGLVVLARFVVTLAAFPQQYESSVSNVSQSELQSSAPLETQDRARTVPLWSGEGDNSALDFGTTGLSPTYWYVACLI